MIYCMTELGVVISKFIRGSSMIGEAEVSNCCTS